ncbi:hypothetical protein ACFPLB_00145 [Aquamicrobium segne]|uniref:Cytoplasmic protein n=1 Tax=Aquamicrobium segne TaxID=469547 RepID=A0ABW0GRX6_9HYPH
MIRTAKLSFLSLSAICTTLLVQPVAQAADMFVYDVQNAPTICNAAPVLNRITRNFAYQVRHVPNLPQVAIADFNHIHLRRSEATSQRWPIARHYCSAKVTLSNGYEHDIAYLIEEGQGFAAMGGANVEFCVSGFDRWLVYNAGCRVLK